MAGSDMIPQPTSAFFYGTLMHPDVLRRVIENDASHLKTCPAILMGYTRHHVKECDYPAIVPYEKSKALFPQDIAPDERCVRGVLVTGLSEEDIRLLDIFEGDEYVREEVQVKVLSPLEPVGTAAPEMLLSPSEPLPAELSGGTAADAYIWSAPISRLAPSIWDYDTFIRESLTRWLGVEFGPEATDLGESEVDRRRGMNGVIVPPELANADASKEETAIGIGDVEGLATPFGHAMLQNFNFAPGYINLNHGSYGSMPKPVLRATEALALEAEARPDKFMRMTYLPLLTRVRTRVAQLINANADECVMVTNTSHGINTVLRNFPWKEGDIIIGFSTTYGAVSRTLKYLSDVAPNPTLSTIELTFPTSHASILERTRAHIRSLSRSEGQDVVMVLDGIISNPGARMPWEEIVAICKEEHVWSVVDAAHCIGQIDIDLEAVQPDFWVSNCHKWLLSKRGSAVLYVPKRNQHIIKSTFPTSIGYKSLEDTNFVGQFDWTGTSDFVPVLSVNAALDFRASIGGEKKINEYCHSLAVKGGKRLAEILGTRTLDETGEFTANMTDVLLPLNISPNATDAELWAILWKFYDKMLAANFFAAIYVHDRKWWTRCSAQIWIELSDFEFVGHALARICAELKEEGS